MSNHSPGVSQAVEKIAQRTGFDRWLDDTGDDGLTHRVAMAEIIEEHAVKPWRELFDVVVDEHWAMLRACVEIESCLEHMSQYGFEAAPHGEPQRTYFDRLTIGSRVLKEALALVRQRAGVTILRDGRLDKRECDPTQVLLTETEVTDG